MCALASRSTHTLIFTASYHWEIICPRNHLPIGFLTATKVSIRIQCSNRCWGKEAGGHVTHPSPPPGIWAIAAFQEARWAPAVHGGKDLRPAAISGWHPRSSAGKPGRSGRRWISAEGRTPEGESWLSQHLNPKWAEECLPGHNSSPLLFSLLGLCWSSQRDSNNTEYEVSRKFFLIWQRFNKRTIYKLFVRCR